MENKPICKTDKYGNKLWYLEGILHREDGPAVEYTTGDKTWYFNGKCHRVDGPAVEYTNETKKWFINDKCHRIDKPAIEPCDGKIYYWYINGHEITDEITQWAKDNGIDLDNLTDVDIALIKIVWADYTE